MPHKAASSDAQLRLVAIALARIARQLGTNAMTPPSGYRRRRRNSEFGRDSAAAGYGRLMALGVQREVLASMLRSHGEDELAERALSLTDDELTRIGTLGAYYAFSEQAMALGGSMGGTRALSLATIDVLENTGRDLRWSRTQREREMGWSDEFAEADAARDRALRVHAIPEQQPHSDA